VETQARHRSQPPSQTRCRAPKPLSAGNIVAHEVCHGTGVRGTHPIGPPLPMEAPGRRYLCAGCRTAVVICSHCDRGNRYCTKRCAQHARRSAMRAAGRRYQRSRRGAHAQAERQRRYRARQQKVTHQGSPPATPPDQLPSEPLSPTTLLPGHCCRCQRALSAWVRQDFLRPLVRRIPPNRRTYGPHPRN
jgi:hypothetical protein